MNYKVKESSELILEFGKRYIGNQLILDNDTYFLSHRSNGIHVFKYGRNMKTVVFKEVIKLTNYQDIDCVYLEKVIPYLINKYKKKRK